MGHATGLQPKETMYKVKITDVMNRVTEIPTASLEEFASLVAKLGPEKVVLNGADNSIELVPRLDQTASTAAGCERCLNLSKAWKTCNA
jgi:hypothetical protein